MFQASDESNSTIARPEVGGRDGLLRNTLTGEYLALALLLHAGFGSVVWAVTAASAPAALAVVATGVWICGRAAGAFSIRWFTPLVTAGLMAALLALGFGGADLPTLALAMFSWPVFVAMLAILLLIDLAETATHLF